jgi:hypothetical protein
MKMTDREHELQLDACTTWCKIDSIVREYADQCNSYMELEFLLGHLHQVAMQICHNRMILRGQNENSTPSKSGAA